MASLSEEFVGITEYVSTLPGFNSILKHRFRDFQVREVDPQGNLARLTSLQLDAKVPAPDDSSVPPSRGNTFDPAQLPAARQQIVESFSALAGPENGALLDQLLRHVVEMYSMQEGGAGGCEGPAVHWQVESGEAAGEGHGSGPEEKSATLSECYVGGDSGHLDVKLATTVTSTKTAEAAPAPAADGGRRAAGLLNAAGGGSERAAGQGKGADHEPAADMGGDGSFHVVPLRGAVPPRRTSVLLLPISSKDVRKALHEFFRVTPGLPPLRTETVTEAVDTATTATQQQLPSPATAIADASPGPGEKRSRAEDAAKERPAKLPRGGGQGGGGQLNARAVSSGRGAGGGGRAKGAPDSQKQQQPPTVSRIEVVFEPDDLKEEGRGGHGGDLARGRGGSGRGGGCRGGRGSGGDRAGGGDEWRNGAQPFVRFVLYKENMDTQVALTVVSRMLGINGGKCFGFAGTKDKRAVTCQFATAFKVSPSRLAALNPRLRGIRVGSFSLCREGLRLGCLAGNEFQLLMRDVRPLEGADGGGREQLQGEAVGAAGGDGGGRVSEAGRDYGVDAALMAQVAAACQSVAERGFINYFGLQRFGSGGAPTHEVGRALLRGEYEQAVKLILTGRPDERPDIAAARRLFFEQGDAKGALRGLPPHMLGERAVLGVLSRQGPRAWATALRAVPRTLRMMYLHAWQSCVWNSAASHRIRTYGTDRVVIGDLVLPRNAAEADCGSIGDGGGGGEVVEESLDGVLEDGFEGPGPTHGATSAAQRLFRVKLVTEEDVAVGRYSIFDVVLPLPGTEVQYPQHETGAWIREAAAEAGVDLDHPEPASAANRELSFASLSGDYRHVLHRPTAFTFAFRRYSDPHDDSLLSTDLEVIQGSGTQDQREAQNNSSNSSLTPAPARIASDSSQPPAPPAAAMNHQCGEGDGYESAQQPPQQQVVVGKQDPDLAMDVAAAESDQQPKGGISAAEAAPAPSCHNSPAASSVASVCVHGTGHLLALELRFQLPGSCYATMLLRELSKMPTSKAHHAGLSTAFAEPRAIEGTSGGGGHTIAATAAIQTNSVSRNDEEAALARPVTVEEHAAGEVGVTAAGVIARDAEGGGGAARMAVSECCSRKEEAP